MPSNPHRETSNADLEIKLIQMENKMVQLVEKLDLMTVRTEDLITAYNTAKGITAFIKWLAGLSAAVGILWSATHIGKFPP